ncbi:Hypothetical predicted protein [Mytilus galloprovincialis]|uniref:Reverse transcriptase domain-containing protein n=1 Tax=Mytilus galloprovincialis TaxID=29158 RepID=A0A8B6GWC3_MYTGA|nr:Hypothetical predicted protein [Mytilus galloprovincialis]
MPLIDPYTEKEVKQAIEYLNTGKSPGEHGICAEHLKKSPKSGILTPVLKKGKSISAFYVVQHTILLDKLLDRGTHPDIWLLIKDFYSGLTSKVKWQGEFSDSFNIQQGVRQGGVLLTHLYQIFFEDLLKELEENSLGFILGTIYCGAPKCADDVALTELKSRRTSASKNPEPYSWNMSGKVITASEETVHLGIKLTARKDCDINIEERIKFARRTKYALMNSGLHGTNALNPNVIST